MLAGTMLRPERPRIPANEGYGPEPGRSETEQLDWPTVERWLEGSRYYWLVTTRPDGRPHSVPLWALWFERRLYYNMSPRTLTSRNLDTNPNAVAHPENAREAVMIDGAVHRPPVSSLERAAEEYERRLGWRPDPTDPQAPLYVLEPRVVRAWLSSDVRNSAVRWRFAPGA